MRRHARVRFRKPHIQSAYVDTRLCHCATVLCGLCFFSVLFGGLYMVGRLMGHPDDPQNIIAAVKREQSYRFDKIGGPLKFEDWGQVRKVVKHCNGSYEAYGDAYARLFDVELWPSKATGPLGGESIETVLNRAENDEYLKLSPGFFTLACPASQRNFKNPFEQKAPRNAIMARRRQPARSFLSEFHNAIEFREVASSERTSAHVNDTLFALTRYEYANFFHTVTYLYNAFLTAKTLGVECDAVHVLFVDAHAQSPLDSVWRTLFRNVSRVTQLPDGVRARELVWLPLGYGSPLMNEALREIPYVEQFAAYFLAKYGVAPLQLQRTLDCSNLSVTFLFRRNYVAHPRNPSGSVPRRIQNEAELLAETERTFRDAPNVRLTVTGVSFEPLSMREQLHHIVHTDILIGMHGAGLTHILFLPQHAGLVEMFSRGTRASHYEAFARWRKLKYKLYQSKDAATRSEVYISPIAITYLIDTILTEMNCCSATCVTTTQK